MHITFVTSEAIPWAKTGGLADVCGALPAAIAAADPDTTVSVILPAYSSVYRADIPIEPTSLTFAVPLSDDEIVGGRLRHAVVGDPAVHFWFIDQPAYFHRDGLYGPPGDAYADNDKRFAFFTRAAIAAIGRLGVSGLNGGDPDPAAMPDVVHCHDWQSATLPSIVRRDVALRETFASTATVLTIHNLAYQGQFDVASFERLGLSWDHFHADAMEFYGGVNFLKCGLVDADHLTTVSPTYAVEICGDRFGCGLDGVLLSRRDALSGILNGIDDAVWNPADDPHLPMGYTVDNHRDGKHAAAVAVRGELGLPDAPEVPVLGLVGRLAEQKGWDLILPVIERHLRQDRPTQWAILGSGDGRTEDALRQLRDEFPHALGIHIGFDEGLAHRIEAASDLFVMPSHYEPCGLNQMYSMRYGSIPVVTPVGGLADTVIDLTDETSADGTGTGFHLRSIDVDGLDEAISRALHTRYHHGSTWNAMIRRGMTTDWSWRASGKKYVDLYRSLPRHGPTSARPSSAAQPASRSGPAAPSYRRR